MPITFVIAMCFILAIIGGAVAALTRHKRAGLTIMVVGLVVAGGLSLSLVLALQNM